MRGGMWRNGVRRAEGGRSGGMGGWARALLLFSLDFATRRDLPEVRRREVREEGRGTPSRL